MLTALQTADFLALARKVSAWDEARFVEAIPDEGQLPLDVKSCVELLIKKGLLTTYQAKCLLSGKTKALLMGSYRVLEPISATDGNVLYLGEHTKLKRRVVIKLLTEDKAEDRASRERFFREARSAAALDHPNIARLFDISTGSSAPFLVLEHLEGTDMQTVLAKKKKLPVHEAVQVVLQAAKGMAQAHERGIVHRDIRPQNLFLTHQGVIKIKGLGLARSLTSEHDNVTSVLGGGAVVETVEYQSPEQILNEPLDQRADVYSLGATLFALITGQPPYRGTLVEIMSHHQADEQPRLSDSVSGVPEELDDIVAKMMAQQPGRRYVDAAAVVKALTDCTQGTPKTTGTSPLASLARPTKGKVTTAQATKTKPMRGLDATTSKAPLSTGKIVGIAVVAAIILAAGSFMLMQTLMKS